MKTSAPVEALVPPKIETYLREDPALAVKRNGRPIVADVTIIRADELLSANYPEPEPVIERLLYPGLTVCQGPPKCGKSFFWLQASNDLVNGWPFLQFPAPGGPKTVLYAALEDTHARTSHRLKRLADQTDRTRDLSFVYTLKPWPHCLEQLDRVLDQQRRDVLIIDTLLALLSGGAQSKSSDVVKGDYNVLNLIKQLADKHKIAALVISHTKKHAHGLADTDAGIGTTGVTAAVDAILTLRKRTDGVTLLSTMGREFEPNVYELEFDLKQYHGWRLLASGSEAGLTNERRAIVELLRQAGPMMPKNIAAALGKKREAVRQLLMKLAQMGVLRVNSEGEYSVTELSQ